MKRVSGGANNLTDKFTIKISDFPSGCNNANMVFRVIVIAPNAADTQYYVRGTPILSQDSARVELLRMPYNSQARCDTIKARMDSTFNNPLADSNQVKVKISGSNWSNVPDTIFPPQFTEYDIENMLNNYMHKFKPSGSREYKFIVGKHQLYTSSISTGIEIGRSHDTLLGTFGNWSYVWTNTIDIWNVSPTIVGTQYSFTACHELLHQLGNIFSQFNFVNDHTYHLGRYKTKCVLHTSSSGNEISSILWQRRGFFRICDRHTFMLRKNLNGNNLPDNNIFAASKNTVFPYPFLSNAYEDQKYEIGMSLAKDTYRKFEPIVAKFTLINHDTKPMNITNLFDNFTDGPKIMIADSKGNTTSINKYFSTPLIIYPEPVYIIPPGDTLYISMTLNNWGEKSTSDKEIYFSQYGYFPKGSYRAFFYFGTEQEQTYGVKIQSNIVEFDVVDNTSEDKELLSLTKEKKYSDVIKDYSENPFVEHVAYLYLGEKYVGVPFYPENQYPELETEYEEYFQKYPYSFYLLSDKFLKSYVFKVAKESTNAEDVVSRVSSKTSNQLILKFLSNKRRVENIITSIRK